MSFLANVFLLRSHFVSHIQISRSDILTCKVGDEREEDRGIG